MRVFAHKPSRHAFLILWGSWTVVALVPALLYDWWHEGGLTMGVAIVLLSLVVFTIAERLFRRRHLPREARKPWQAIVVLFLLPIPVLVLGASLRYDRYLPWSDPRRQLCHLRIERPGDERAMRFKYEYDWEKSNWGRTVTTRRFSETRIWNPRVPDQVWILDQQLGEARPESASAGTEVILLTRAGYEDLFRRLADIETSPGQVAHGAEILRDCLQRRRGIMSANSRGPDYSFRSHAAALGGGRPSMWPWLWVAGGAFSICLFPVTMLVVRATIFPAEVTSPDGNPHPAQSG